MRTSLRVNYVITYILLLVSMLLIMNFYGRPTLLDTLVDEEETSLYESANLLTQEYVTDIDALTSSLSLSVPQLRKQFKSLHTISGTRIWLVDSSGVIVVDSNTKDSQEGTDISHIDRDYLNNQICVGNYLKALLKEKTVSLIYPLTSDQSTRGYIVLIRPLKPIEQRAGMYTDTVILSFFIFFSLLLIAFIFMDYQTTRPLKIMTKALKEYADGHFDYQMEKMPGHEYKSLAAALQYFVAKMRNMNDYQKKFIANVSHDFRSPLTSIRGYTEALIDGTIPMEMQEKYLNIILFETQRLTKLTKSLLELNQFENKGIILEPGTFDINHAIKLTTSSFEQRCTEKRISIELIFSQKELLVDGDVNKIEQVIQNLVDNAIKFSNYNSTIEIRTSERSNKVFVSVKDHGIGIPKDSLSKVWDRFYKSDLSRGKDKTGTGLGLSITKEILEAHGENINVISTEGAGTEFIFSLKAHAKK